MGFQHWQRQRRNGHLRHGTCKGWPSTQTKALMVPRSVPGYLKDCLASRPMTSMISDHRWNLASTSSMHKIAHLLLSEMPRLELPSFSPPCCKLLIQPWDRKELLHQVHGTLLAQVLFFPSLERRRVEEHDQKICVTWWDLPQHHKPFSLRRLATTNTERVYIYLSSSCLADETRTICIGKSFWSETKSFYMRMGRNSRWPSSWGCWWGW